MSDRDGVPVIEMAIMAAIFDQFRKSPRHRGRGGPRRRGGRRFSDRFRAMAVALGERLRPGLLRRRD